MTVDIEMMRLQASNFVAQMKSKVSLATVRPLPVFLGLRDVADGDGIELSTGAFNPPAASGQKTVLDIIKLRIKDNWAYFLSNYCLLAAMVAVVVALMHPIMLIILALLNGLWWCHGYLIRHEVNIFNIQIHSLLTVQQRFYLLFAISTVVVIWACFIPAIVFIIISTLIILTHAAMRDTTTLREMSERNIKAREESEGGSGKDVEMNTVEKDPLLGN